MAEVSKTVEPAEALAKQIEELKASTDEERVGFELRLAGARSVTAALNPPSFVSTPPSWLRTRFLLHFVPLVTMFLHTVFINDRLV